MVGLASGNDADDFQRIAFPKGGLQGFGGGERLTIILDHNPLGRELPGLQKSGQGATGFDLVGLSVGRYFDHGFCRHGEKLKAIDG
jgi:hypothetical protein